MLQKLRFSSVFMNVTESVSGLQKTYVRNQRFENWRITAPV